MWLRKVVFGIALHDRGPISDKQEKNGVDPNWEFQFNPPGWKFWGWIGSPFTVVGITPNFNGDTSQLYAAINYEFSLSTNLTDKVTFDLTKTLFVSGTLGPAIHTGPLRKDETGCREHDDCGFGYRVLPRFSVEIGSYFMKNHGVSLFLITCLAKVWDQISMRESITLGSATTTNSIFNNSLKPTDP